MAAALSLAGQPVDVDALIRSLRGRRRNMVGHASQYAFIYRVCYSLRLSPPFLDSKAGINGAIGHQQKTWLDIKLNRQCKKANGP